jgi:hypothetical protein
MTHALLSDLPLQNAGQNLNSSGPLLFKYVMAFLPSPMHVRLACPLENASHSVGAQ